MRRSPWLLPLVALVLLSLRPAHGQEPVEIKIPAGLPKMRIPADNKVTAAKIALGKQLFFDNRDYFRFVERARAIGITVPIVAGIMPITNLSQVKRFTALCGAAIPGALLQKLERSADDEEAVRAIGVDYATAQCRELLAGGVPGIHFYTLNRSLATRHILDRLR